MHTVCVFIPVRMDLFFPACTSRHSAEADMAVHPPDHEPPVDNILVTYNVVNGSDITQLRLSIPKGSNSQKVMEMGANENNKLRFQVTYFNDDQGYYVDKIGDTGNVDGNQWFLYVGTENDLKRSKFGVSHCIPDPDSIVEWRYELDSGQCQ